MTKPTRAQIDAAEKLVKQLHGVCGFNNWVTHIAKALAAEAALIPAAGDEAIEHCAQVAESIGIPNCQHAEALEIVQGIGAKIAAAIRKLKDEP